MKSDRAPALGLYAEIHFRFVFPWRREGGSVCGAGGKLFVAQIYVYDAAVFA